MSFFKRREAKVNVEELHQQTAEVNEFLEKEGPRMSAVATWLNNRKGQNGLGEDFDITFYYPRGA